MAPSGTQDQVRSAVLEKASAPVAKQDPIKALLERHKEGISAALPRHLTPDRMLRVALTCVRTTPKLELVAQQDPASLIAAIVMASQLGVEPGGPLGECYILPFEDRRAGKMKAQFILGYKGMIKLARQSGKLRSIEAREVCESDTFDFEYGLADKLVHRPNLEGDRGKAYAYYGVAHFTDGGHYFLVLSRSDVEKHRARSKAKDNGPWQTDYDAMARKGLALDTPIPTPTGWTTMGLLEPGDTVFDVDGQRCRVLGVSETKHIGCYRVTFANGASIVCDEEHYWLAGLGKNAARDGFQVHPIADLAEAKAAGTRVTMPVVGVLDLPWADLPIDPWVLGFWLGDGNAVHSVVTCHQDQVDPVTSAIASAGYRLGAIRPDTRSKGVSVSILGLRKELAELGLLGHKHVPPAYLRGSSSQRLGLLRGLMDSDGSIDLRRGRAHFCNTNLALADAVAELARSLGEVVTRQKRMMHGFGRTIEAHYVEWLPTVCPFALPQKVERFRQRQVASYRGVASIERIESVPTRCIAVDSPTRTFVAGYEMVPTHNTVIRAMAPYLPLSVENIMAMAADGAVMTGKDIKPDMVEEPGSFIDANSDEVDEDLVRFTTAVDSLLGELADDEARNVAVAKIEGDFGPIGEMPIDSRRDAYAALEAWVHQGPDDESADGGRDTEPTNGMSTAAIDTTAAVTEPEKPLTKAQRDNEVKELAKRVAETADLEDGHLHAVIRHISGDGKALPSDLVLASEFEHVHRILNEAAGGGWRFETVDGRIVLEEPF